jgi:hypothetical protein
MKRRTIRPIRSTKAGEHGTLVYDGIKDKIASSVRLFYAENVTYVVLDFKDDTQFQIAIESEPTVRLTLLGHDKDGDLEPLAESPRLKVPVT